ncbi:hypothetical protein LG047_12510 [Methylocystis sp. WRRC1]|uniref:hypothetical protein n=1 Tax=unclassified Methylocystis TaxID=2625913 RepID=UPI0001F86A9B|nr:MULTISPECIES: hypothetical protein [unclassified Methylocystis]MCC3246132.1 hypothetical protein [Methylocystis sp. WRRC1]
MIRRLATLVFLGLATAAQAGGYTNAPTFPNSITPRGPKGDQGCSVLPTTGAPAPSFGRDCDWAFDAAAGKVWGPKALGQWGAPLTMSPVLLAQGFANRARVDRDGAATARAAAELARNQAQTAATAAATSASQALALFGPVTTIGTSLFPQILGRVVRTGDLTAGSTTIDNIDTTGLNIGDEVTGGKSVTVSGNSYTLVVPGCIVPHGVARNQIVAKTSTSITITCAAVWTPAGPPAPPGMSAPADTQTANLNIRRDMYSSTSTVRVNTLGAQAAYIGGASKDGANWLNGYFSGFVGNNPQTSSPLIVTGLPGGIGGPIFAHRSSDGAVQDNHVLRLFNVGDDKAINGEDVHLWSLYGVTFAMPAADGPTAQATFGEFEIYNGWGAHRIAPHTANFAHVTTTLTLGCGGGSAGGDECSGALYIFNNSTPFLAGIVFRDGSLSTSLDGTGLGYALDMPTSAISGKANASLHWSGPAGANAGDIYSDGENLFLRVAASHSGFLSTYNGGNLYLWNAVRFGPQIDNARTLGSSFAQWSTIYGHNIVIDTSITAPVAANGSVATTLGSVGPAGAHASVQEWIVIKGTGGANRYVPGF